MARTAKEKLEAMLDRSTKELERAERDIESSMRQKKALLAYCKQLRQDRRFYHENLLKVDPEWGPFVEI